MNMRAFLFCNSCNPQAIRVIDRRFRQNDRRDEDNVRFTEVRRKVDGRRNSDGRAWFDGTLDAAIKNGWVVNEKSDVLCPTCIKRVG